MEAGKFNKGDFVKADENKGVWKIVGFEIGTASKRVLAICEPHSNQQTIDGTRSFPLTKIEFD